MMTGPEQGVRAFVDAHCHIDLYKDPQKVIDQAEVSASTPLR